MGLAGVPAENVTTPTWVLDLIARQKAPNFSPGEQYLYSNTGYFLLAQLVDRATGQSLREYSQEKFFGPLGMRHTHFHDNRREVVENRALAYSASDDGFIVNWSPAFAQVGSGGLLSTIEDLVEWDRSYYDGRLGPGFWDHLQGRGRLRDGEELSYAFGLTLDEYEGHRRVQHGGAMFGYRAQLSRFPDKQLTVAVLCNLASADPARRASQVADLFLPGAEQTSLAPEGGVVYNAEAPTVQLTTAQLDAWVGDYFVNGAILEVTADRGGLLVTSPVGDLVLAPLSDTEFRLTEDQPPITDPRIRFTRTGDELSLAIEIAGDEVTSARLAANLHYS